MAFPIPSFLQFAPPEEAIADIGRLRESALNREQNREINLAELGLKRQQLGQQAAAQAAQQAERMQEMEFRQLALQNNMTRDAAALAQEKAKMDAEAQVAMIQFQGMQDFQRDVAAGLPFEQAIQRHIPKIAFGNPAALAGVANTLQRTKTQEEIAAGRDLLGRDLLAFREEVAKSNAGFKQQELTIKQAALDAKESKLLTELSDIDRDAYRNELSSLNQDFQFEPEKKAEARKLIVEKYESKLGKKAPQPSVSTIEVGTVRRGYVYNGKFPPSDKRAWDKE